METIEQIFFRKINPSDFRNMYSVAVPSSGGGQTYIEAAGIPDDALLSFLDYAEMIAPTSKQETRMAFRFNCYMVNNPEKYDFIEFQPRRGRNYRIVRQTENHRHPAWSVVNGFPAPQKDSNGVYVDDSTFTGIIDNLLIVIIRTSYRKYYAWFVNENSIPANWPRGVNLEKMFAEDRRGILVFEDVTLGFVSNDSCPFVINGNGKGVLLKSSVIDECFQLITYGAPGTGKSFNIDKIVNDKGCVHFRTTFHPDSDYASFVGCYKPIVKEYDRIVALGKKIENAELDAGVPDELRKERKIEYMFVEQAFTKAYVAAWKNKASAIANGGQAAEPVYLIIEEINRGNCAQVFGDIFQLLDREGGFSKYPICADDDLHRHLESVFKGLDFGSQYAKVQTGEELVLPDNLYIWATMNTSDQSLFPMDSAFKRRWDWEYVPISEGVDENTKQKLYWNIVVKDVEKQPDGTEKEVSMLYSWWQFLQIINTKIYHLTDSEDKELGYFFVKPDSAEGISAKLFVNKVVFYLWTDVYKNYGVDNIFKGSDNGATTEEEKAKGVPFRQFFDETGKNANTGTLKNFFNAIGLKSSLPTA